MTYEPGFQHCGKEAMEMRRIAWSIVIITAVVLCGLSTKPSYADKGGKVPLFENLGNFHHPITTNSPLAQRYFDQGLTLMYSFNHGGAARSFREAARLDPNCAMAYWGAAIVLGPNINAPMAEETVHEAYSALQKALQLAGQATEKEQAYIRALSKRFSPEPLEDRTSFDMAYAQAMREVAQRFPEDPDAGTLYAEALMILNPWNYWTKDGEPRPWTREILTTLESVLKRYPNHPGANHYYIHAVEASPNPERGLPSADRLPTLVPGVGHMVHMLSHIYIRIGRYHDALVANQRAIKVDEAYIAKYRPQGDYKLAYYPHNYHFLGAASMFEGKSRLAIQAARGLASRVDREMMRKPGYGTLQHFFSMPLYTLAKFGKWDEILREPAPAKDLVYPTGVWHYARGMAYTRTGWMEKADRELEKLREIAADPTLMGVTIWNINSTSSLLAIATEVLAGELAAQRGDYDKAVSHLEKALHLEEALTYDEPDPWPSPVRQSLGAILIEAGRPKEAEKVYLKDLKKYPENGWSLFGLYQALRGQDKTEQAEAVKGRFEKAWARADVTLSASRF
jgi:tetratricopeptide (TPR) repeat protein